MRFQIGDLVKIHDDSGRTDSVAIVIDVNKANISSLSTSVHSRSHVENSSDIYYVFSDTLRGPYFNFELTGA